MGLDVGVFRAEEFLGAIDGELFDFVGVFATTVVTLAWVAFSVFVGEDGAHGFEDGFGDEVFRRDEFQPRGLAPGFVAEEAGDLWIDGIEGSIHAVVCDRGLGHEVSSSRHTLLTAKSGLRGDFIEWGGGKPISWLYGLRPLLIWTNGVRSSARQRSPRAD